MLVNREEEKIVTYLDGQNEKTAPIPTIKSVTGVLPVTIGGGVTGAVDEVGIFNVVLALDDVVDIMNKGLSEILAGAAVSPSDRLTTTDKGESNRSRKVNVEEMRFFLLTFRMRKTATISSTP